MKIKKINILIVRTYYPHWGKYAGPHQYAHYLDKNIFHIKEMVVPMGEETWKFPIGKNFICDKINDRGIKPYKLNDFIAEIKIFIKAIFKKINIIVFHDAEHTLSFLPELYKKAPFIKKPIIVGMYHQPDSIMRKILPIKALSYPNYIILMSPGQKDYFLKAGVKEKNIKIIPLGVNTEFFSPSSNIHNQSNEKFFKLLTVGVWQRDYEVVFFIARHFKNQNVKFIIVASKINVPNELNNVEIFDNLSDEQLLDIYRNADALLMPLKDATANHAILEGMACGLPIIATDLDGTSFYVGNENGFLLPPNSVDKMISAINELINDHTACKEMQNKSRARAVELSWEKVAKIYERYFTELLQG